jgi:Flp pilus assembly protein TadD/Fe-S-cluster containining protein
MSVMKNSAQDRLFGELEELYQQLTDFLPKPSGNPCGTCRACCTSTGVNRQSVTDLELDFIADRVGPEKVLAFQAFAGREKDREGRHLFTLCPYYNEEAVGCEIHAQRPFSCRTYGPYRLEGTRFPEDCSFDGQEKVIPRGGTYQEIPLADTLRHHSREYWPFRGHRIVGHANQAAIESIQSMESVLTIEVDDPVDSGLMAMARGEFQQALESLETEGKAEEEPFRLHHLAMLLTIQDRHQEANAVLNQCLVLAPDSWDVRYNLALNLYNLGDLQGAFHGFLRAAQLNPLHALAWGFLGYLGLSAGQPAEAVTFFETAVQLDPENSTFRFRLATIYLQMEKIEEAIDELRIVLNLQTGDALEAQARALLAKLEA